MHKLFIVILARFAIVCALNETACLQYLQRDPSSSPWLLRMIDASSKIPPGIAEGNLLDLGNYDECVSIDTKTANGSEIKGKYCAASIGISLGNASLKLSVCIPHTCELADLFPSDDNRTSIIEINDEACQVKGVFDEWFISDYFVIAAFVILAIVILTATMYDVCRLKYRNENYEPNRYLLAFSIYTNINKLLATSENTEQLKCIHGIKAFSMMWIIAAHRFALLMSYPKINALDIPQWRDSLYSCYIQSAQIAVETFFFLTGFLIAYGYFSNLLQHRLTAKKVPLFYLHRILRLCPALFAMYVIIITIFRKFSDGPFWPAIINHEQSNCKKYWWSFIFFIQNYANYNKVCILPTWYLSADMQLFLLSPLIILPLGALIWRDHKSHAYQLLGGLIVVCIVGPAMLTLCRYNPNKYDIIDRLSTFLIGILAGMLFVQEKLRISKPLSMLCWTASLISMAAVVLLMNDVQRIEPTNTKRKMFFAVARPTWSIALGWVIIACSRGAGGVVNWILTRPCFQILGRLSYSMYLLHLPIMIITYSKQRSAIFISDYVAIYMWCGDFIFTMLASFVWVLAFESPIITISKLMFRKRSIK